MDGAASLDGTNPATLTTEGASVRQIGRVSMSKDRRVRKLVWFVLIAAAVVALLVAAPPTRTDAVTWTGWTMA